MASTSLLVLAVLVSAALCEAVEVPQWNTTVASAEATSESPANATLPSATRKELRRAALVRKALSRRELRRWGAGRSAGGDLSGLLGFVKRARPGHLVLKIPGRLRLLFPYNASSDCAFSVSDAVDNLLSFDGCFGPFQARAILGSYIYKVRLLGRSANESLEMPLPLGHTEPIRLLRLVVKKAGLRRPHRHHHHEEDVLHASALARHRRRRSVDDRSYRSPYSYTAQLINGGRLCAPVRSKATTTYVKVFVDKDHFYQVRRQRGSLAAAKEALEARVRTLFTRANNLYKARRTGRSFDIQLELKAVKPTRVFPQAGSPYHRKAKVNSRAYLEHFCRTFRHHLHRPHTDHLVLVSGKEPLDDSFEGLAMDFGVMCSRAESCSLVFARAEEAAVTLAHEVGHTMGLYHDGPMADYGNGCPVTAGRHFIMSPWTTNVVTWSQCSSLEMEQNIGCFPCMRK